jgi:molecular chaperone GrpE
VTQKRVTEVTPEESVGVPAAEPPARDSAPVEEVRGNREVPPAAEPPVRASGPVEGVRGNREVPPAPDAATDLEVQLREAEAKRDEYLDQLQRVAADFDNFRKRIARDQAAIVARAHERLVEKLLPVLDDLERALDAAEQHDDAKVLEGVRMTKDALVSALQSEGLQEIQAAGAFDPHVHEALMTQPVEDAESGQVVEVIQKGYRLGNTVVRPARVIVAE